jgi:ribosome-associated translation inhibitor RaiA
MKLDFRLRGFKDQSGLHRLVQSQLGRLPNIRTVSEARVILERQRDATPAWTARAHLQVPGPDLLAEGRDHTVEAAWRKVMAALQHEVERRLDRRRRRGDERRSIRPAGRMA